jgi:TadE-like protein
VEFALVLPLLLLLVLATLEVALLVKDQIVVQGAARAGAREAAVSTDDAQVRQAVLDAAPGVDGSRVDVVVDRGGQGPGEVSVRVTYHDAIIVPAVAWLFPSAIDLSAAAVMQAETG